MKNIIFLAYANRPEEPLPSLQEEDDHIFRLLLPRSQKEHFSVFRESHSTRTKLIHDLGELKDEIIVFQFSGHAGRDRLLLEDEQVMANGVASFLAQCPKLRLVILNGCSTKGQVERLIELKSDLVVISTSAPVEDKAASEFSKTFFQAFSKEYTSIKDAFDLGIAAAKTVNNDLKETRGIYKDASIPPETPTWDISSKSSASLDWKLPVKSVLPPRPNFKPNSILTKEILEGFIPLSKKIAKAFKKDPDDRNQLRWEILKVLPLPISEELRKLFAVPVGREIKDNDEASEANWQFFRRLDRDRLNQLINTYNVFAELLGFIHLTQLWHHCSEKKDIKIEAHQKEEIRKFFYLDLEKKKLYNWFGLVKAINHVFIENKIPNFLIEFPQFSPCLEEGTPFSDAIAYFQRIITRNENNTLSEDKEIIENCVLAEEHLAIIFKHLSFIINYRMESIKSIGVYRYRNTKKPIFSHEVTKLRQKARKIEETKEERFDPLFTASVFLTRNKKYLNLTPFVIDQNAFYSRARVAKIYHFFVYEEEIRKYAFKHVYNPNDNHFDIMSDNGLQMIIEQFEDFKKTVLNY